MWIHDEEVESIHRTPVRSLNGSGLNRSEPKCLDSRLLVKGPINNGELSIDGQTTGTEFKNKPAILFDLRELRRPQTIDKTQHDPDTFPS
jgi:hypothetical protein